MRRTILTGLVLAVVLPAQAVRFVGKTKYLNNARAAVVHSIDDSTIYVPTAIDAMDKYGIKATIFVSTEHDPAPEDRFFTQLQIRDLWPRLRKAIADGHEIGSHSRQHPCKKPDSEAFCAAAYTDYEITGSRDDILRLTQQLYVWSWCYPCGNCAPYPFIQKQIAAGGYIVARNYPNEATFGHVRPNVQDFDDNPMNAGYTQAVQHANTAKADVIDVASYNAKFDEVYAKGGVYNFMSHPQWLDFGPENFYEQHLRHIGHKRDVWYAPMGPLYAFRTIRDATVVKALPGWSSFAVSNDLDRKIYSGTLTLEFEAPAGVSVLSSGRLLAELGNEFTDRWDREYVRREGAKLYATVYSNTKLEFFTPPASTDVSGTWKLRYHTQNGRDREASLVLKQSGGRLSGTISSERGTAPITEGSIEGSTISLAVMRKGNGDHVTTALTGTVKDGTLYLSLHFPGSAPLAATATR
ncbi:MAG: polysaccharide deacetylase family protein [Acidobacteriota bacterium]